MAKTDQPKSSSDANRDLVKRLIGERDYLRNDQQDWLSHWKQISEYFDPYSGRYLNGQSYFGDEDKGRRKDSLRLDSTATKAMRVYRAGLSEGLIPQTRPWFRLKTADTYHMGNQKVKEWFFLVEQMIYDMMDANGFYNSGKSVFTEAGLYGSSEMMIYEHPTQVSFCEVATIGEFVWGADAYRGIGSSQKYLVMTNYEMAKRFGNDALPKRIQQQLKDNQLHQKHNVTRAIFPNDEFYKGGSDNRYPWKCVYYLDFQDEKQVLEDKGFYSRPIICTRNLLDGCSVYGRGEGMETLGDVKELQKKRLMLLQALGLQLAPPMNVPNRFRPFGYKVKPNAINYIPDGVKAEDIKPVFAFQFDLANAREDIIETQNRIKDMLYTNEFLAVLGMDKQATMFEVARRIEEKITILGPTLDYYKSEFIAPAVERHYNILREANLLPPAPPELSGVGFSVEYTSVLSQAQKMIGASTFEQSLDFEARVAQAFGPEVLMNVNVDEKLRSYYEMTGMPPNTLHAYDKVLQSRDAARQEQQAASQAAQAEQGAKAIKDISQAKLGDGNALEKLAGVESE